MKKVYGQKKLRRQNLRTRMDKSGCYSIQQLKKVFFSEYTIHRVTTISLYKLVRIFFSQDKTTEPIKFSIVGNLQKYKKLLICPEFSINNIYDMR